MSRVMKVGYRDAQGVERCVDCAEKGVDEGHEAGMEWVMMDVEAEGASYVCQECGWVVVGG